MNQETSVQASAPPTHVRYGVLGFACSLSMITYLDRVCFGSAMPHLREDLGLTSVADLKWAVTAFAFAYAVFEVPSGWLGDVYGPRKTLIRIVLWWSLFTALTGFVYQAGILGISGLALLVIIRFLFGMGEAGAYPNITRALHNWFPFFERGSAQGAVWMAGRLMGGLTPLVWLVLVEEFKISWRAAFALRFRNRPEEKPEVNAAEAALIQQGRHGEEGGHGNVPWFKLLTNVNLWTLCMMYFCAAYGWYFNITYLHTFLQEQHAVEAGSWLGAVYKGGPLWLGAVTCLLGGWLSDRFIRRTGNRKWGRRLFGIIGHALCGLCYLACLYAPTAFTFFLAISFAAFWNDLTMGSAWATCQDIGKRYAAIVAGCMNTIGNLGGAVAGWVTGTILEAHLHAQAGVLGKAVEEMSKEEKAAALLPGYNVNFLIFAGVYFLAVLLWMRIDATKPIETGPETVAH